MLRCPATWPSNLELTAHLATCTWQRADSGAQPANGQGTDWVISSIAAVAVNAAAINALGPAAAEPLLSGLPKPGTAPYTAGSKHGFGFATPGRRPPQD